MDARDAELKTDLKKELDATLHARRELGEEYDAALVDSFLGKIEQRVDGTIDRRMRRHLAEQQMVVARGARSPGSPLDSWSERFGFGVLSLILAVPLSAIGAVNGGLTGLLVTWAGIFGVNAVHANRDRKPRPTTEWDD
ncbi:hypothetical protein GKQ77_24370 [Streptomyces sp. BG9H]|uniref:Integral membrane protein n=1 Tax=Streptomyces anatolicus TaxID=2675858 RepID=A0ABS6YVS8_9ACTN|nr:hypothetical protein [Streptomyces anatolicus]MBW5424662.1 hypothetical protein [Streptomyces anatolicus]